MLLTVPAFAVYQVESDAYAEWLKHFGQARRYIKPELCMSACGKMHWPFAKSYALRLK